jgi:hypothetical protein
MPAVIREATKPCLRDVAPGGSYWVGSGSSFSNYVPIENYRAVIATVHLRLLDSGAPKRWFGKVLYQTRP